MKYSISVADLFSQSVFQNSDTFSTDQGLHHEIGTCTIMDIPTIIDWLNPHDVVIVGDYTASCLTSDFVKNLHEKEIACLITKKKFKANFTKEIIKEFYDYNLPIIQVSDNYAWSAVIRAVQQLQFNHYRGIINEQENFYQALIRSSVNHSSHGGLGSVFNTNTGSSLAIIDTNKNLVDASYDIDWVPILKNLELATIHANSPITTNESPLSGNFFFPNSTTIKKVWSVPVYYHRRLKYYILIGLTTDTEYLPTDLAIKLESVKKVIAIKEELQQEVIFERFFKVNEAFQTIAINKSTKKSDFSDLQSLAGIPLHNSLKVIQINSSVPAGALFENSSLTIQATITQLINHIFSGITIYHDRSWIILTSTSEEILAQKFPLILNRLNDTYADVHFRAGISQTHEFASLNHALIEASGAIKYLEANQINHDLQFFSYLGISQLFIDENYQLNNYYMTTMLNTFITPLVEYDDKHHTELIKTLDCFIRNQFSHTKTSEELFIHKNTLRNRITKIEELIGSDHADFWLNLQISYRLYQQK